MSEKVKLTKKGFEEKTARLQELVEVIQPENTQILKEARSQGDLSENADYDAAKEKQGQINAEIEELRAILSNYEIIDESGNKDGVVSIGASVTFLNLKDKKKYTFQIVGSQEADPFVGKISDDSLLAQAILGHKKGDKVQVNVANPYSVEIISVEFGKN